MFKKVILFTVVFLLNGCAYDATPHPPMRTYSYGASGTTSQQIATVEMAITVCSARANAAVPHAADMQKPQSLHERARLIEWYKVNDACIVEKGGPPSYRYLPALKDMKQCDRDGRKEMPSATLAQQNTFIDDCLDVKGFSVPWK